MQRRRIREKHRHRIPRKQVNEKDKEAGESGEMNSVKRIAAGILVILLTVVLLERNTGIVMAATDDGASRMNVVFVLDESGSMSGSDENELRYEAVDLFLGIATDAGNYMGAVSFDDTIVLQEDIKEITGKELKDTLSESIRRAQSKGDTDIGKAVELATRMLMESGNSSLSSAIILLSDGNTDLPKDILGEAKEASATSKKNAIESARNSGIKIYTICLNSDGTARKEELQEISDATGGNCVEVKSPEDLKKVFSQFYDMIYSTDTINLADTVIPSGGELEIPFDIPMIGVEEANIIINTLNEDTAYNLFNPDGYGYTQAEMQDMEIKARTFTIIKIKEPEEGEWKLIVRGVAGDQVIIDMVYNSDLIIEAALNYEDDTIHTGEDVEVTAQLVNSGRAVSDEAVYQSCPFKVNVRNIRTGNISEYEMEVKGDHSSCVLQFDEYGDTEIQIYCDIDNVKVKSETITLNVDDIEENPVEESDEEPEPVKKWRLSDILALILIPIVLIIIIIILILVYRRRNRMIRGRIQISGYTEDGFVRAPETFDGSKGKMMLSRCLDFSENVGINMAKTYLVAGERDSYIYLVSKTGYYTDVSPTEKNKKIRLEADMEVDISSDIDFGKGIKVTYMPNDMGY